MSTSNAVRTYKVRLFNRAIILGYTDKENNKNNLRFIAYPFEIHNHNKKGKGEMCFFRKLHQCFHVAKYLF